MTPMSRPVGLVLAGGAGRRLGRPKGELRVGGTPLALRAAAALAPVCAGVLVSVRPGAANPAPGYAAIEDRPPAGRGPLAGIGCAFAATGAPDLLVLACDYPGVETELLRQLLSAAARAGDEHDVVLARDAAGRDHPLVARWRRSVSERVRDALERGAHRVGDLVARCSVLRVGPDAFSGIDLARALVNVNRPEDLDPSAGAG